MMYDFHILPCNYCSNLLMYIHVFLKILQTVQLMRANGLTVFVLYGMVGRNTVNYVERCRVCVCVLRAHSCSVERI